MKLWTFRVPSTGSTTSTAPAYLSQNLDSAIKLLETHETPLHRHFIIGGASIYANALALEPTQQNYVDRIILTRILSPDFEECDVFMPDFVGEEREWTRAGHADLREWVGFEVPEGEQEENGVKYEFQMWIR
jgi:dihydrofolate reductase